MQDVEAIIRECLEETSGYDFEDLKEDDDLIKDLGMDSLDLANLANQLESRLNIAIGASAFQGIHTVSDVISMAKELTESRH